MLTTEQIKRVAQDAAKVAYTVLGLDCKYTLSFIEDPTSPLDGMFDTHGNIISLNLAVLKPFSSEVMPGGKMETEEDKAIDENYRHLMKVYSTIYHEMRHLYQKRAVEAYTINKMMGGGSIIKPLESKKKCELWLQEMKQYETGNASGTDVEADADDFAYYLTNRHPVNLPMLRTNRRIGNFKRKYDKVDITV